MGAGLAYFLTKQYDRSINAFERGIELNPSLVMGYSFLGGTLAGFGRPDEGIAMIEKAIRLSSHDPFLYERHLGVAAAHLMAAHYEEAVGSAKRSLELKPDQPGPYRVLAASYGHLGRVDEARAALDVMYQLVPHFSVEGLRVWMPDATVERYVDGWRKLGWTE